MSLTSIANWILDKGTKYEPLLKAGTAALSTYASWKDQQKKNEMQQAAYDDFMAQAEAAGHEARAAIDINYTPMVVSGVPTTKADVTDFTAVAARGGLMNLPTRQRKRYATRGFVDDDTDVMEMDEEVFSPGDFKMETGVDVTGEQVKYNTGNSRESAWSVWNSGGIDQELYEFDFEIFFDSGDWTDMLKGQVDVEENRQMASADPILQDEYDKYVFDIQEQGGTPMSIEQFREQAVSGMAIGGIAGLRHGGRPGYAQGSGIMNLGGLEKDYRTTGGFVPIGGRERADDVPARLSKNEFVMTADAVRAAGGGSINKGAQRMYDTMKHLEASPQSKRMTA